MSTSNINSVGEQHLSDIFQSFSFPPTPDEIQSIGKSVAESIGLYGEAKLREIDAKTVWDEYFAIGLADGTIDGKNEQQRLGMAIDLNPGLWLKRVEAIRTAIIEEHVLKVAQEQDKVLGRLLLLHQIQSGVSSERS